MSLRMMCTAKSRQNYLLSTTRVVLSLRKCHDKPIKSRHQKVVDGHVSSRCGRSSGIANSRRSQMLTVCCHAVGSRFFQRWPEKTNVMSEYYCAFLMLRMLVVEVKSCNPAKELESGMQYLSFSMFFKGFSLPSVSGP